MNIRLTLDKAGRIVIPKQLREELRLEPGDDLERLYRLRKKSVFRETAALSG